MISLKGFSNHVFFYIQLSSPYNNNKKNKQLQQLMSVFHQFSKVLEDITIIKIKLHFTSHFYTIYKRLIPAHYFVSEKFIYPTIFAGPKRDSLHQGLKIVYVDSFVCLFIHLFVRLHYAQKTPKRQSYLGPKIFFTASLKSQLGQM